ncbi:MAG: tRNA (guanosine(46)-N7)-methyltransferase TrmB [Betaproteobacteria bacterium]|nr:tRNA (guanosine(46)-N7)-methyltransferase TrmB [Betaproteobacteria bacterium]
MNDASTAFPRPIRSFVLRQGRLSKAQERALRDLLPVYGIPFDTRPIDLDTVFGRQAPKVLEIGFGMGTTTLDIARAHPGWDFLGIEVHGPGVGSLLNALALEGLTNVRVIQHDAVEVLRQMIASEALHGIHVFFPDPWHKKRHHKRRLVNAPFAALAASRITPGGYIHLATDWEDYATQMLAVLSADPQWANTAEGFAPRPDHRPLTKFEARGLRLGHGVWDILFRKVSGAADSGGAGDAHPSNRS